MYHFAAAQQPSTAKIPTLFQILRAKVRTLKINETKITAENDFNRNHLDIDDNQESNNDGKTLF